MTPPVRHLPELSLDPTDAHPWAVWRMTTKGPVAEGPQVRTVSEASEWAGRRGAFARTAFFLINVASDQGIWASAYGNVELVADAKALLDYWR